MTSWMESAILLMASFSKRAQLSAVEKVITHLWKTMIVVGKLKTKIACIFSC